MTEVSWLPRITVVVPAERETIWPFAGLFGFKAWAYTDNPIMLPRLKGQVG